MGSIKRTIKRKGRFGMQEGVSGSVKVFRRTEAQRWHRESTMIGVDLTVQQRLQRDHPERDLSEKIREFADMFRRADDVAKRLVIHAGLVRAELEPPVHDELRDKIAPTLRAKRDQLREMLSEPELYEESLRRGAGKSPEWPLGRPPMSVADAEWSLAEVQTSIDCIDEIVNGPKVEPPESDENGSGTVTSKRERQDADA